ncbi:putative nucleotidyltransferase [Fictibacillus halophilus]|uniref:Nucleotidyltransferase n=1 Tax=Fictibacillus halophilus TaxID=1610490 RepID=A0ABV2LKU4_9BACL|nr:aminoglycoside adenylyltransferase domain-containing protein [Fictibacillus halophilus]
MIKTAHANNSNSVPKQVKEVLNAYFEKIEKKLPNKVESFYLFGSVSIGAYQEESSDIDFYAVTKEKLTQSDVEVLKEIHHEMRKQFSKPSLDGMYLTRDDLEFENNGNSSCPYFNEGKLQSYRPFHRNWIDAYQLQTYGIVVKGLPIETYNLSIDWTELKSNLIENINGYWLNWVKNCERFPSLQYIGLYTSANMNEWGVLGVTRLYYSLREKDITSKVGAGEYALRTVPETYHQIIREALRIRNGNKFSHYGSMRKRRSDALSYMKYIIRECNNL